MGTNWATGLVWGLTLALLGSPALAAADRADAATAVSSDDDAAGNADLVGTWVMDSSANSRPLTVRFTRRDRGQLGCVVNRQSDGGGEESCEITRSGNYLTIFAKVIRAAGTWTQEALFVTVEQGEMVGRMISGEVSEVRLRRRRSDQDLEDAKLLRQEANEQVRADAKRHAESEARAEAEAKIRARIDAESNAELPVMVRVPAGTFTMGFPDGEGGRFEPEAAQHEVKVRAFELSKYAITFAQWDACVRAGGCAAYRPDDRGWGRGSRPVINVSWDDAQTYVTWLAAKTGKRFRLPTESEWEYAARAGTTTARYWGAKIGSGNANCTGCGSEWDGKETAPVGSFKPNAFGLHDMLGNVWQWTEDCYRDSYEEAPKDGSAVSEGGDCDMRVARGGAWNVVGPASVRSGYRSRNDRALRYVSVGFRVARSVP